MSSHLNGLGPFRAKDEIWFLRVCHRVSSSLYHSVVLEATKHSYLCTNLFRTKQIPHASFLFRPHAVRPAGTCTRISHGNSICITWRLHRNNATGYVSCGSLWKAVKTHRHVVPAKHFLPQTLFSDLSLPSALSFAPKSSFKTLQWHWEVWVVKHNYHWGVILVNMYWETTTCDISPFPQHRTTKNSFKTLQ